MGWCAYVDESEPDPRFAAGTYLLAAAVIETDELLAARAAVAALRLRGQKKLHWRGEGAPRRRRIASSIAALPMMHTIVVKVDKDASSERRRRLCMARLLPELHTAGVTDVYLESREKKQNAGDIELLNGLRRQKALTSDLRIYHVPGPNDALLWVPDVVAGAMGSQLAGEPVYLDMFATTLVVYDA
ncbi:hypothetical protein ACFFOU_22095 [Pseudonocardia sulfidoxydans]|nr:DUF3800 domain-containing protein [Pseudonocardia sulfidoxydans]